MTFYSLTIYTIQILLCINAFIVMNSSYVSDVSHTTSPDSVTITNRVMVWFKDSITILGLLVFYLFTESFTLVLYGYILIILAVGIMRALDPVCAGDLSRCLAYRLLVNPYTCIWLIPLLLFID